MALIDIKKVKEQAQLEVVKEHEEAAKIKIKTKLKELETAKKIVRNLERELEDLYAEITESL